MEKTAFPKPLIRVTAGSGGEAVLILGSDKTALYDCGMACFGAELIENINADVGGRALDYVILSHSHYDHMGALPYVLKEWPNAEVCASQKTAEVFGRASAVEMIISMGKSAAELYGKRSDTVIADGIRVDRILASGDVVELGDEKVLCIETKGHTDCSMSFFIQPSGILLTCESTGVMGCNNSLFTSILKDFDETLEAASFLKLLPYKHIVIPHYGMLPDELNDRYFDMYIEEAQKEKSMIEALIDKGLTAEEIFEEHKKVYWNEERAAHHPFRAYKMNTEIIIKRMMG